MDDHIFTPPKKIMNKYFSLSTIKNIFTKYNKHLIPGSVFVLEESTPKTFQGLTVEGDGEENEKNNSCSCDVFLGGIKKNT